MVKDLEISCPMKETVYYCTIVNICDRTSKNKLLENDMTYFTICMLYF